MGKKTFAKKTEIVSLKKRNIIIDNILKLIEANNSFLLIGHKQPDEDCVGALVSIALIIRKFNKKVTILVSDDLPDQITFLQNICSYNQITLAENISEVEANIDVIFVLDTPKPELISAPLTIKKLIDSNLIPVIEIDHHLASDASLIGNRNYSLVTRATSTCELIAIICCKLNNKPEVIKRNNIQELFTRNLVLSLLTGIIGDTWFGLTAKLPRDRFFYNFFSKKFNDLLKAKAHPNTSNYTSINQIFNDLQSLTSEERELYQQLLSMAVFHKDCGYILLDERTSYSILERNDYSLFIKVIKAATNYLAEKSGKFGITVFYDLPSTGGLIQFRVRLSKTTKEVDLRNLLTYLSVDDGGGHPGAIGFRFPKNALPNIKDFFNVLLEKLESL